VTVLYSTVNGTAQAVSDYTPAANATLVIPAGATSANATIIINPDLIEEGAEDFTVNFSLMFGGQVLSSASTVVTITDDDTVGCGFCGGGGEGLVQRRGWPLAFALGRLQGDKAGRACVPGGARPTNPGTWP
jgi:hypothetical protein